MRLTRRDSMRGALALGAASLVPLPGWASPLHPDVAGFTGGEIPREGGMEMVLPATSEDPQNIAVSLVAEGAEALLLVAPGNPGPRVLTVRFGPGAVPRLTTRIRLAGPQTVIAVARLREGGFVQVAASIDVDEGACAA
ncbi:MAG: thiosulfate oxidation carrier protein SoxY [Rhodobacteraceae bacterium]|nr:thiosulfate oxidation carrier protein SoxY [Paracoccaceae bacterium]